MGQWQVVRGGTGRQGWARQQPPIPHPWLEMVVFWAERTLGGIDRGVDRGDLFSRSILALKIPEHRKGASRQVLSTVRFWTSVLTLYSFARPAMTRYHT